MGLGLGRDYTFLWSLKTLAPIFIMLPFVALNYTASRKKRLKRQRDEAKRKRRKKHDDGDDDAAAAAAAAAGDGSSSDSSSVLSLEDYAEQRELELVHTKSVKTILVVSMLVLVFGVSSCAVVWYCPESPKDGDGLRR